MTLQPPLIRSDRRRCVLATVEDARRQLAAWEVTEDTVLELIETGSLPFAWNIALSPRGSARLWRILPDCLDHFDKTGGSRPFALTESKVYARLLEGQHDKFLSSTDLRLLLNCSPLHITTLIDAGELHAVPIEGRAERPARPLYRRGPGGAARIPRADFLRFLKSRAEGAC